MRTILASFGCLILLILFLPLFLIFIGPLLVLAALRGRQPVGPIMFNTSRYGPFGRIGAFMLGLAIWILVWSGLAWIVVNGLLPAPLVAGVPLITTPSATTTINSPTPSTERQDETPALPSPTFTVTPTPLSPTPSPTNPPPVLMTTSSPTPLPDSTPPSTETPVTDTPKPTTQVTSEPLTGSNQLPVDATEALTSPLSLADQQIVITTVEQGNLFLREAISLANQENIQNLETVWRDQALAKAQDFVTDLYGRYIKPFDVQFEYIISPTVSSQSTHNQATVVSQETWLYQGRTEVNQEAFEFTYTLNKENGHWVITKYNYRNLPTPTPIPTSTRDNSAQ